MGRLVIDGVEDVVMERLARLAASNNASMEEQVRALLTQSLPRPSREDLVRHAETIAAMTPKDAVQTDSVPLLRQDRDR